MNWNWNIIFVVFTSIFLLITCYTMLEIKKFKSKEVHVTECTVEQKLEKFKKIKSDISSLEELNKIIVPQDHIIYYFPSKCPDYKQEFYLISVENGLDRYYVPEEKHLIIVNKNHHWNKKPDFDYWTSIEKES